MRRIGDALQERREDLGLDLDEVGAMLRIKPAYLAALEQGRTHDLPGPTYAIGFVRAYADFLGLNTEPVVARFKSEAAGITARPDLALPVPLGERSLPGRAVLLVALILSLCGYGIWYYLSTEDRNRPERVAAVPATLQPQPGIPPAESAPQPPRDAMAPPSAAAVTAAPGTAGAVTSAGAASLAPGASVQPPSASVPLASAMPAPAVPSPIQQPAAAPPPVASPQVAAQPAAPLQATVAPPQPAPAAAPSVASAPPPTAASKVTIRAIADCWIQIRGSDQSIVFSRVLKSGEVYSVPSRPGLSMRTGNAGALEIAVDGKPAPSIGGIGTLRRDVGLDPAELAAGTAVHG